MVSFEMNLVVDLDIFPGKNKNLDVESAMKLP